MSMFHVYCIVSEADPAHRYIGFTEDLRQRVAGHNAGCNLPQHVIERLITSCPLKNATSHR